MYFNMAKNFNTPAKLPSFFVIFMVLGVTRVSSCTGSFNPFETGFLSISLAPGVSFFTI